MISRKLKQISKVSFNELGNLLGLNSQTIQRYIDLLEKAISGAPNNNKRLII